MLIEKGFDSIEADREDCRNLKLALQQNKRECVNEFQLKFNVIRRKVTLQL